MKANARLVVTVLASALFAAGCESKEGPVDGAKDALNMRNHEKLKDAGEDAKDAIHETVDGVSGAADGP
jgi:hypothetical protein